MKLGFRIKNPNVYPLSILIMGGVLVFVSVSFASFFPLIVLSILTLVSSALSPIIGAGLWILPAPFEAWGVQQFGISPFVLMSPAVLVGFLANLLVIRNPRLNLSLLFFAGIIILAGTMSLALGEHSTGARNLVSVLLSTSVAFAGTTVVIRNPEKAWVIILGLTLSALVAGVYAVTNLELGSWRLKLDTGVRELTNPAGLSVAALITVFFYADLGNRSQGTYYLPLIQKGSPYIVIFLMIIVVGTVSRGAILALAMAATCTGLLYLAKALFYWKLSKKSFWLIIFFTVLIVSIPVVDISIAGGRLYDRMLIVFTEPGENLRWLIWGSAISSIEGIEWIFGAGLGSYRELSHDGYYPHSVYIGALVEMGIAGLTSILLPMVAALFYGLYYKGIPLVFFWVYAMTTFLTHGSLYTKWYYYGIIVAVALSLMMPQKQKSTLQ